MVRILFIQCSKYVLLFENQSSDRTGPQMIVRRVYSPQLQRLLAVSCAHLWTLPPQSQVSCNLEGEKRQLSFFCYALVCQGTPGPDEVVSDRGLFLILHLALRLHLLFRLLGLREDSNLLQVLLQVDRLRKCLQGRVQKVNSMTKPHLTAELRGEKARNKIKILKKIRLTIR